MKAKTSASKPHIRTWSKALLALFFFFSVSLSSAFSQSYFDGVVATDHEVIEVGEIGFWSGRSVKWTTHVHDLGWWKIRAEDEIVRGLGGMYSVNHLNQWREGDLILGTLNVVAMDGYGQPFSSLPKQVGLLINQVFEVGGYGPIAFQLPWSYKQHY